MFAKASPHPKRPNGLKIETYLSNQTGLFLNKIIVCIILELTSSKMSYTWLMNR